MRPSICRAGLPAHILALVALMLLAANCATRQPAPEDLWANALLHTLDPMAAPELLDELQAFELGTNSFQDMLVVVEQGNAKSWFDYPESPRPDRFDLAFPNNQRNRDLMRWLLEHPDLPECSFLNHQP